MRHWGILRCGAWAAWAAAYALVINAVLASSLLAAMPAAAFGNVAVLCVAHPDSAAGTATDGGTTARAVHHCKLCLPGSTVALPPPAAPEASARIAVAQPQHFAFETRLKAYARFDLYHPRGPPARV